MKRIQVREREREVGAESFGQHTHSALCTHTFYKRINDVVHVEKNFVCLEILFRKH